MHQVEPHSVYQAAPRFGGLVLPPLSPSAPLCLHMSCAQPPAPLLLLLLLLRPCAFRPSVRSPLCAFTLRPSVVALCPAAATPLLQSHIDVPPGDTSTTHRSPTISNGFVLIGRESGEKGGQFQVGENMSATDIGHQGLKPLQQNNSQTPGLQGGFFFKLSCATEYQHPRALLTQRNKKVRSEE